MSNDFKEGYADGTGQACSNMESMLLECLRNNITITEEIISDIADNCRVIDQ